MSFDFRKSKAMKIATLTKIKKILSCRFWQELKVIFDDFFFTNFPYLCCWFSGGLFSNLLQVNSFSLQGLLLANFAYNSVNSPYHAILTSSCWFTESHHNISMSHQFQLLHSFRFISATISSFQKECYLSFLHMSFV